MASEHPQRGAGQPHAARSAAGSGEGRAAAHDELETALRSALPELTLLDRDLELGPALSADVVGREPGGRLVLVIACEGEGDAPVLAALDALVFATRHGGALEQHLGWAPGGPAGPAGGATSAAAQDASDETRPRRPLVVLISERFTRKLQERLAPLAGREVALFEMHRVKSRRGSSAWLVPVAAAAPAAEPLAGRSTPEEFLAALPGGLLEVASQLARRIPRLDEAIQPSATEGGLSWSLRGAVVARVTRVDGALRASAHPHAGHRMLRSAGEVDPFLEEILRGYLQLAGARLEPATSSSSNQPARHDHDAHGDAGDLGDPGESPEARAPGGLGSPDDPGGPSGTAAVRGDSPSAKIPTVDLNVAKLTRPQPTMTPEEYQAFRD